MSMMSMSVVVELSKAKKERSIYYEMVWGCQGTPSNHGTRKLLTGPFKSNTANVKNHTVYCFWSCFNPSRFLNMYSCIPPCHNNPSFQPAIASINLVAGVYGRNYHLQRQNFYFYKPLALYFWSMTSEACCSSPLAPCGFVISFR